MGIGILLDEIIPVGRIKTIRRCSGSRCISGNSKYGATKEQQGFLENKGKEITLRRNQTSKIKKQNDK